MLNISVVLYNTLKSDIERIIETLNNCNNLNHLYIIDNSPEINKELKEISKKKLIYHHTGKNLGYGKGHNIALTNSIKSNIDYHLVLNPDVYFSIDSLDEIINFMNKNKEIGHLLPKALTPNKEIEFYCKLLPSPINLFARSFLPKKIYKNLNDKYELKKTGYNKIFNSPSLSGCFMFLRVSALKEVGIFDEDFFMYLEDVVLTRRMHKSYKTVFYPPVTIIHRHEKASYKSMKMKLFHIHSAIKYFNKYGWIFDSERKHINEKVLKQHNIK